MQIALDVAVRKTRGFIYKIKLLNFIKIYDNIILWQV